MGSGSSKSSVKERNIQNSKRQKSENKNQQEGSKSEDNETDSLQNDGSQTRPRVNVNNNDESDHKAEVESIPKHNGKTQLKKEEDFKEQERKRLDTISKLKSGVNNQIANIRKCKEDKLNTFQVTNMSRQLQQFCFSNGLVQKDELRINPQITNKLAERRQEKTRLLHKLSEIAGTRLKHNNPNLADLSDENRPTKLVNRLSELYDNDWTDFFERVREKMKIDADEKDIICYLRDILKQCYEQCRVTAETQRQKILQRLTSPFTYEVEPTLLLYTNNLQKKSAEYSIKFLNKSMKDDLKHSGLGPIIQKIKDDDPVYTRYVEGCTDIMWHTQIQSPPLVLDFETKNKDWYKKFTSPGQNIDYIVWPAVFLYGNGPLLAKGIAQFIKRTEGEKNKTQVFHLQNEKEANTGMAETSVESNHSSTSNCENVLLGPGVNDRTYNFDESQRRADVETMRKEDSDKQTEAKRTKPAPINTSVKRPKNARK